MCAPRDRMGIVVHRVVDDGDEERLASFTAGSVFASPNLSNGTVSLQIPRGISLTITTVNYVKGSDTTVVPVLATSDSQRFPLCLLRQRGTVSGLDLTIVGPQTVKLEQTSGEEVYVLGSVSPATYDYKSDREHERHEKEASNSSVADNETATCKKRKLSNVNESPSVIHDETPLVHVDQQVEETPKDMTSREDNNDNDDDDDDGCRQNKQQMSKRQRKKLAKKKAKELANAVAFLNKHQSKVESSASDDDKKARESKTTTSSLTRERRLSSGVLVRDIMIGTGPPVKLGRKVSILYQGTFPNGKVFDKSKNKNNPLTFRHGCSEVIKGLEKGIEGMRVGGEREITVPPEQGYGKKGSGNVVPPNATLVFAVQLVGVGG